MKTEPLGKPILPNALVRTGPVLVFSNIEIRRRDDLLCLTDMWRAGGSDDSKRPAQWAKLPSTQEFSNHVADMVNVGFSHIIETEQGRTGGTWAHWQVAMAYAKYLSPAFHAWCNEVVRAHMEKRPVNAPAEMSGLEVIASMMKMMLEENREERRETRALLLQLVKPTPRAPLPKAKRGNRRVKAEVVAEPPEGYFRAWEYLNRIGEQKVSDKVRSRLGIEARKIAIDLGIAFFKVQNERSKQGGGNAHVECVWEEARKRISELR